MDNFIFIPVGGLANRMKAVASAFILAQQNQIETNVIWFQDWALHAPFNALFEPIYSPNIRISEASFIDHIIYDRPRKKNLYIPRFFQYFLFQSCLYEKTIQDLKEQNFDFGNWVQKGHVYMASYLDFQKITTDLLCQLFIPLPTIQKHIDQLCKNFSAHTIGVHIRRTDNLESIQQSPIELFFTAIDKEIDLNADVSIYLATDDESVKQELKKRYGKRLIYVKGKADRSSIAGIQGGIVDMYVLARTQKIFGSFHSSFSELAAQIGNIPLEIIKKE